MSTVHFGLCIHFRFNAKILKLLVHFLQIQLQISLRSFPRKIEGKKEKNGSGGVDDGGDDDGDDNDNDVGERNDVWPSCERIPTKIHNGKTTTTAAANATTRAITTAAAVTTTTNNAGEVPIDRVGPASCDHHQILLAADDAAAARGSRGAEGTGGSQG